MSAEPSPIPAPYINETQSVLSEWIDMNGHMNIAYYLTAFDRAFEDQGFEYLHLVDLNGAAPASGRVWPVEKSRRTGGTSFMSRSVVAEIGHDNARFLSL